MESLGELVGLKKNRFIKAMKNFESFLLKGPKSLLKRYIFFFFSCSGSAFYPLFFLFLLFLVGLFSYFYFIKQDKSAYQKLLLSLTSCFVSGSLICCLYLLSLGQEHIFLFFSLLLAFPAWAFFFHPFIELLFNYVIELTRKSQGPRM